MPTIPGPAYTLTRAEARWILTGMGRSDVEAEDMLDDMATDKVAWTSVNLRAWHRDH